VEVDPLWNVQSLITRAFNCDMNSNFASTSLPSNQEPLNLVIELWHYTSLIYNYLIFYYTIINNAVTENNSGANL